MKADDKIKYNLMKVSRMRFLFNNVEWKPNAPCIRVQQKVIICMIVFLYKL